MLYIDLCTSIVQFMNEERTDCYPLETPALRCVDRGPCNKVTSTLYCKSVPETYSCVIEIRPALIAVYLIGLLQQDQN